jgi:hypothetical protein
MDAISSTDNTKGTIPATNSPPAPVDPAIQNLWLRDVVAAYNATTRPTVILVTGIAVAYAAFRQPAMFEIVGIAAGLAGGVGFLRSMDKKTESATPSS